jgi:hypothetical protein
MHRADVKTSREVLVEKHEKDLKSARAKYLRAVERTGTLTAGCRAARVSPNTVYAWREHDAEFTLLEQQARNVFADNLEAEAVRRAWHGALKPIYQQGVLVGSVAETSDVLLMFLLKAVRPEKYRERVQQEVSGTVAVTYTNDWRVAQDETPVDAGSHA